MRWRAIAAQAVGLVLPAHDRQSARYARAEMAAGRVLCGDFILVETAEAVAPADAAFAVVRRVGRRLEERRALLERTARPMRVVARDVLAQHPLEVRVQTSGVQKLDSAGRRRVPPRIESS